MIPTIMTSQLKAMLFPDVMLNGGLNVQKEKCYTVQNFNYYSERSRNGAGFPYGPANSTVMSFTVRLVHPEDGVIYHKRLLENNPADYTFLFNASFNGLQRLKAFDMGLIVNGYVIDVEDDFSTGGKDSDNRQMLIRVKLFVRSITYKGKTKDEILEINS